MRNRPKREPVLPPRGTPTKQPPGLDGSGVPPLTPYEGGNEGGADGNGTRMRRTIRGEGRTGTGSGAERAVAMRSERVRPGACPPSAEASRNGDWHRRSARMCCPPRSRAPAPVPVSLGPGLICLGPWELVSWAFPAWERKTSAPRSSSARSRERSKPNQPLLHGRDHQPRSRTDRRNTPRGSG